MNLYEKVAELQKLNMQCVKGPFEVLEYEALRLSPYVGRKISMRATTVELIGFDAMTMLGSDTIIERPFEATGLMGVSYVLAWPRINQNVIGLRIGDFEKFNFDHLDSQGIVKDAADIITSSLARMAVVPLLAVESISLAKKTN